MKKNMTVRTIKRQKFFIVFVIAALAILITVYFAVFCRVKLVTVQNNETVQTVSVLDAVRIMPRRHLFSISERKVEKAVLAISPYVRSVQMERKLPSEIVITIEEHRADYYILKDEKCYLVSDALFVLEEIPLSELDIQKTAHLTLPDINEEKFGVGKTIRFAEKEDDAYIADLIRIFSASPLSETATSLSLREKANITADVGGKYHIKLGNSKEFQKKIELCEEAVSYLTENMNGISGTLHAWTTEKVTFEITGVSENP